MLFVSSMYDRKQIQSQTKQDGKAVITCSVKMPALTDLKGKLLVHLIHDNTVVQCCFSFTNAFFSSF